MQQYAVSAMWSRMMENVLALNAGNTHLYPGARLTAHEAPAWPNRPTEVVVVFGDHSHAEAVLTPSGEDTFVLQVETYSTAAGTAVGARSWHLGVADDRTVTVKSRADPPVP